MGTVGIPTVLFQRVPCGQSYVAELAIGMDVARRQSRHSFIATYPQIT